MSLIGKKKRWIWRTIWFSILLILFYFDYYTAHQTPKKQLIGTLKPWQTFSQVQVQGILLTSPRELKSGGWFGQLADESGTIFLFVRKWPLKIPKQSGIQLLVKGRLTINKDRRMSLQALSITQIPKNKIKLSGRIIALKKPKKGSKLPYQIRLQNSTQPLDIVFWFHPSQSLSTGMTVKVIGVLNIYKEQLQLQLKHPKDLYIMH